MQEGDYVQLDNGYQGYVENVGWRYTTIRERANNIISIPNSVLSGSISKNFNIGGLDKLFFSDGTVQTSAGAGGGSGTVSSGNSSTS